MGKAGKECMYIGRGNATRSGVFEGRECRLHSREVAWMWDGKERGGRMFMDL